MRILLFDVVASGHHPAWLREFAGALSPLADVTVCASEPLLARAQPLPAECVVAPGAPSSSDELDVFADAARRSRADHAVHLYGVKPVLRAFVRRQRFPVPVSLLVISPPVLHYPDVYGTRLSPLERLNASYKELLVRVWRRRSYAHAVYTLDEEVVRRWSATGGADAFYLPEPPVDSLPDRLPPAEARSGCLVFGYLSARKRIDLVTAALSLEPTAVDITIAGAVEPSFRRELDVHLARLTAAGANVTARLEWSDDAVAMSTLARARCVVIPYVGHKGTSRVLVEAASVGTPVVAPRDGMVGHLVTRHDLGFAVDMRNPADLRHAILALCEPGSTERYEPSLRRFAANFTRDAFAAAVRAPFVNR